MHIKYSDQLLTNFPTKMSPREIQKEILAKIAEELNSGYKKIVVSAPTGSGKSAIAVALANTFKSSFIVTSQKSLQDQYTKDFRHIRSVKGMANFACLKQMERHKPRSITDRGLALERGMTCNKGECKERYFENGKRKTRRCKFQHSIETFDMEDDDNLCPYYKQKYIGLLADHSLWNYAIYFQTIKSSSEQVYHQCLENRRIAIFDEAHKIENEILNFIGLDFTTLDMERCKMDPSRYNLDDVGDIIDIVSEMEKYYSNAAKVIEESKDYQINPNYNLIKPLLDKCEALKNVGHELKSDPYNFVIDQIEEVDHINISVKPLQISRYIRQFFISPCQIFMSATIDRDSFCETTGIPKDKVGFVDTPKSPFRLENRCVDMLDVAKLVYKTQTPEIEMKIVRAIDNILDNKHPNDRGIILTTSKKWCDIIYSNLLPRNKRRIKLCHASNNPGGKSQKEILEEHATTLRSVLLSSSLWEGVDLKDDLSRFQIIAKIPYPPLSDKRTRTKMYKYPLWYSAQTLTRLLQGFGRSIRNERDWARTYVLDSKVHDLISSTKNIIPKSYYDTLGFDV